MICDQENLPEDCDDRLKHLHRKLEKNKDIKEIAEELELENNYVEKVTALLWEDPDRTDEQVAELLLCGKEI